MIFYVIIKWYKVITVSRSCTTMCTVFYPVRISQKQALFASRTECSKFAASLEKSLFHVRFRGLKPQREPVFGTGPSTEFGGYRDAAIPKNFQSAPVKSQNVSSRPSEIFARATQNDAYATAVFLRLAARARVTGAQAHFALFFFLNLFFSNKP